MPFLLLLGLLSLSLTAAAQYDAGGQNTQGAGTDTGKLDPAAKARVRAEGSAGGLRPGGAEAEGSSSAGASSDAARARAGSSASVEGGAALGATGVNTQPAVRAEQAEKQKRRAKKAD